MKAYELALASLVASCARMPPPAVPFVEDDWPRAVAEAKRTGRPIFVDVWATWCEPCMEMRRTVLTDPSLAAFRDSFVWLSIDHSDASSKAFLLAHPTPSLPTLYVLGPDGERVVLLWDHSASAETLTVLLATARDIVASGTTDEQAIAARWADALEAAATRARTPDARIFFDGLRLNAYLTIGQPERAVPMLERSEVDFPRWFEPPARLAKVYRAMGRIDDAAAAVARALDRIEGPRSRPVHDLADLVARDCATTAAPHPSCDRLIERIGRDARPRVL